MTLTPAELRTALADMLQDELGAYTTASGASMGAAIRVGEPPSDWTADGIEVVISAVPTLDQTAAYNRGILRETNRVRLIDHGAPADHLMALRRILSRWATAQATEVPGNESLGILHQHIVTIP